MAKAQERWIVHSDSILKLEFDGEQYYVTPVTDKPIVLCEPPKRSIYGKYPMGLNREPSS